MKLPLLILLLSGTAATAQDTVSWEQQSNIRAETQIAEAGSKLTMARSEVVKAIEEIKDQKERDSYRNLFEKNEKAWAALIDSTVLLQQPIGTVPTEPDVRHTRVLAASYSEFRIKQYQDFVVWLKQKTEG